MAGRFRGIVGYAITKEVNPGTGVYSDIVTERTYSGDVLRAQSNSREGQGLNNNLSSSNRISIVADPYAYEQAHAIRYVVWRGIRWQVTSVEDSHRPRLILTLGGVYNDQQGEEIGATSEVPIDVS